MNLTRSALTASVVTVALWSAKAVAIGLAGGLGKSPAETPLFLLGLLVFVVASALVGAAAFARRSLAWRVLGAVVAFVALMSVCLVTGAVVNAVEPARPGWVYGELNLWVMMLVLLAAALWLRSREGTEASGTSLGAREGAGGRDRGARARVGTGPGA